MSKKIDSAKRWLGLLTAIIIAIILFTMAGCNTTKKAYSKEVAKSDSSVIEKKHETTATETAQKADIVTNEVTTSESNFEVITVDSGKNVVVSDGSEYFTVETKKPTKFILPKKSEKKVVITTDKSTVREIRAVAKVEEKKVEVVTEKVVVKKDVKKTRVPFWLILVPFVVVGVLWANEKYNIYSRIKKYFT